MIILLSGLGLVLLGAVGLLIFIAVRGLPEEWQNLTSAGARAALAAFATAILTSAAGLAATVRDQLVSQRILRWPSPQGDIAITPKAVRQLAQGLLVAELGLSDFRIKVRPAEDGMALHVSFRLPSNEEAPNLGRRIQDLLTRGVEAKTGIPVHRVFVFVRGATFPKSHEGYPPSS